MKGLWVPHCLCWLPTKSSTTPQTHAFKRTCPCAWISLPFVGCLLSPTFSQQATERWAPPRQGSKPRKEGAPIHKATQKKGRMDSQDEEEAEPGTAVLPRNCMNIWEPAVVKNNEALGQQQPRHTEELEIGWETDRELKKHRKLTRRGKEGAG